MRSRRTPPNAHRAPIAQGIAVPGARTTKPPRQRHGGFVVVGDSAPGGRAAQLQSCPCTQIGVVEVPMGAQQVELLPKNVWQTFGFWHGQLLQGVAAS